MTHKQSNDDAYLEDLPIRLKQAQDAKDEATRMVLIVYLALALLGAAIGLFVYL